MSSRRRRGGGHGGEFHVDERWMASYMDMVTVLMCLFIVMYAISSVNTSKFKTLADSLATGFGQTKSIKIDATQGVVIPEDKITKDAKGFSATTGTSGTAQVKAKIEKALKDAGVTAGATVTVDSRGVVVSLVGSAAYFNGNDASLRSSAVRVLQAVAPTIASGTEAVSVEGFAEPKGSPGAYGTDWNLAAARALSVLTWLVSNGHIAGDRISAASYGSAHSTSGTTPTAIEHNRRVDIVLHTAAPQPTATAATAASAATAAAATSGASATSTPAATKAATSGH